MPTFYESLAAVVRSGESMALGIITETRGSSPQKQGAKALFLADGRIIGTMGGGCLEAEIQDRARQALRTGKPETFDLLLDHDFGWDDGLVCGGRVGGVILPRIHSAAPIWGVLARRQERREWGITRDFEIAWAGMDGNGTQRDWLYRETVAPPCALWIAGAGHIAQAVAPLALGLDFTVTVFDDRPALANYDFFPAAAMLRVGAWEKILSESLPGHGVFGLIVTRGHRHDALVLRHWIGRGFAFLGMIGSRRKARTIREHFLAEKIGCERALAELSCPVGVKIAAQTVPEIAVSILAQYIDQRASYVAHQNLPDRIASPHAGESDPVAQRNE
ncbi:MAG TPA: XdhC family protein [Candidatus Methylacidiphilales bacterium]|nr:XdhC family protein [Candidatus Methylacidiphilales bacterium]